MQNGENRKLAGCHRMRRPALRLLPVVLAAIASGSGCSEREVNYTGIWKGTCSDYWGVLIRPAGGGLYSVTFCGLSGCLEPGEWTPDTRIEGDSMYRVVSPKRSASSARTAAIFRTPSAPLTPFGRRRLIRASCETFGQSRRPRECDRMQYSL